MVNNEESSCCVLEDRDFLRKLIVGIGEVAEITGIPQRQLRYWEQKGIIKTVTDSSNCSTRRFDCFEIKKIILIKELLDEGYTLEAACRKVDQRRLRLNEAFQKLKK
jgi:DNA-binding transcriptional MerR regulator